MVFDTHGRDHDRPRPSAGSDLADANAPGLELTPIHNRDVSRDSDVYGDGIDDAHDPSVQQLLPQPDRAADTSGEPSGNNSPEDQTLSSSWRTRAARLLPGVARLFRLRRRRRSTPRPKPESTAQVLRAVVCYSWINWLLVFVPLGITASALRLSPSIVLLANAAAVVPLSGVFTLATENVAVDLGDAVGALLNVSFGNASELIIFVIALMQDQIVVVQASLIGSILVNLLLILGSAILVGGVRYQEQEYNSTATDLSATLLCLSAFSLVIPTVFYHTFRSPEAADAAVLLLSRATSITLLLVYPLYLYFQLNSHAHLYTQSQSPEHADPEQAVPERAEPEQTAEEGSDSPLGPLPMQLQLHDDAFIPRGLSLTLMVVSTALVAVNGELLVASIHRLAHGSILGETFVGLIVIPIAGNAAEQVTAVSVAARDKMDLSIGVAVGSSIQIGLYITPLVVVIGWLLGKSMTLRFSLFNTVTLLITVLLVNFLILRGRTHYLKGVLLCVCYVNIAVAAGLYPNSDQQAIGQ